MSESTHNVRFPNESIEYRTARNELLEAEIALRRNIEAVAELRRALPPGGEIMEDYVFEEGAAELNDTDRVHVTSLSELFAPGKDTLIIYNFMYGPAMEVPCPYCTSILDGLDRVAPHAGQRINLAVVAKSPIPRIREFARQRGWTNLRLLSSASNNYD